MFRAAINHIELVLTAIGVVIVALVAAALASDPVLRWPAAAGTAVVVGIVHGILFWIVRRRRERQERCAALQQHVRDRLLIATQQAFTAAGTDATLLPRLADLAVLEFADWCTVFLTGPDGKLQRVALASGAGTLTTIRDALWQYELPADAPYGYTAAIREQRTEYLPTLPPGYLDMAQIDPAHRALMKQLEIVSSITVPLIPREYTGGAVGFLRCGQSTPYTLADRIAAEDLAQQVTRALDHATLTRRTQRQFHELDTLRQLARLMVNQPDLQTIVAQVVERIHQALGYQLVSVYFLKGEFLVLQEQIGYSQVLTHVPVDQSVSGRVLRTGLPAFVPRAADDPEFLLAMPGIEQGIIVPLRQRDGVVFGVLLIESMGDPYLTHDDLVLLELLADHIGVAFGFAFLSHQLHDLEVTLRAERSLFTQGPVVVLRRGVVAGWPIEYLSSNIAQFGYDAADLIRVAAPFAGLLDADDLARVSTDLEKFAQSGRPSFEQEYRIRTAEGVVRWVSDVTLVRRTMAGEPTHYDGYLIDITDRVAAAEVQQSLERQLLAAHKLESLGMLAAGVAHDFNNLLTVIVGNAGMIALSLPTDNAAQESLDYIRLAARRATDLTQQILTYAGKGRFAATPVQLNTLVLEAVDLCRTTLASTTHLDLYLDPDLPLISGDSVQLHQIVMNLLVNASDALEGVPGEIIVTTGRRVVESHHTLRAGAYAVLMVQDTGIGMDEATQARMFDPFFSTKPTGRGLGLAAVLGIVRQHEGTIDVQSARGIGTTLYVLFPLTDVPRPVLSEPHPPAIRTAALGRVSGRALVIDDEPAVRTILARVLERLGYDVVVAANGPAGIAEARAGRGEFALVFLDITMPEMSGVQVREMLRAAYPQLPIVLMSGYTTLDLSAALNDDPFTAFLPKPFLTLDLQEAIAALGVGV